MPKFYIKYKKRITTLLFTLVGIQTFGKDYKFSEKTYPLRTGEHSY